MAYVEKDPSHGPVDKTYEQDNLSIARSTLNEMSRHARDAVTTQVDRYLPELPSTSAKPLLFRIDLMIPDLNGQKELNQGIWLLAIPNHHILHYYAIHEASGLSLHDAVPTLFATYNVLHVVLDPVRADISHPDAVELVLKENRFPQLSTEQIARYTPELNRIEFHSQLTADATPWQKFLAAVARILRQDDGEVALPAA